MLFACLFSSEMPINETCKILCHSKEKLATINT